MSILANRVKRSSDSVFYGVGEWKEVLPVTSECSGVDSCLSRKIQESMAMVLRSSNDEVDTFKAEGHVYSCLSTVGSLCFLDLCCRAWIL